MRPDGSNPRKHIKKYPEEKLSGSSVPQMARGILLVYN